MVRFSRVSKKKESEKTRFEAQADLYSATKKYHEVSSYKHTQLSCGYYTQHLTEWCSMCTVGSCEPSSGVYVCVYALYTAHRSVVLYA